ncbi:unnamed protein product [Musa textilis]
MHIVIQVLEPCTLYIVNSMVIFPTSTQTYMTINVFFFCLLFWGPCFCYCCCFLFLSKREKFKRGVYFVGKNNEAEIARMLEDTKIHQSHHLQYSLGLHFLLKPNLPSKDLAYWINDYFKMVE